MPVILALLIGVVFFVLLLKVVIAVAALAIGLALAVFIYFAAEKLVGRGR